MANWGDLKEAPSGGGGNRDIKRLKYEASTKVRLVGPVVPRYVYWMNNNEGRRQPIECLSFNRETQSFENGKGIDPVKEIDPEILGDQGKSSFAYVTNVINRADNEVYLMDIKATVYKLIIDLAQNPEYGDPSDPVNGYDLDIKKEKTGPQPMNVRYSVVPGRNSTPITEAEADLDLYDLDTIFKRTNYDAQRTWLLENTKFYADSVPTDLQGSENEAMTDLP
jgi:hypothetical protein